MKSEMIVREIWPGQATPTQRGEIRLGGDVPRSLIFDYPGDFRALLLSAVSPNRVYDILPEAFKLVALHSSHRFSPNKTPEPTTTAVTPRVPHECRSEIPESKSSGCTRRAGRGRGSSLTFGKSQALR
ncbi:hypothetical protein [Horticoccus sp. 23ND18S-11]|uniref:hypothetical protein n=1 Tax=Horticoccus sp. 23ND18S-11 TaxID=3391832 RepID=UPI0039C9F01E